jgi:hypothetical protein
MIERVRLDEDKSVEQKAAKDRRIAEMISNAVFLDEKRR